MTEKTVHLTFAPKDGWNAYSQSAQVLDFLAHNLQLKENGGTWTYYNCASDSCLWSLENTEFPNHISVSMSGENQSISGIEVESTWLSNNDHYLKFIWVLNQLSKRFLLAES